MDNHSVTDRANPVPGYAISGIAALRLDAIPADLKALPQWVSWQSFPRGDGKKPTKVPINPATGGNAKSNDPSTWGTFDMAVKRASTDDLAGIGLMFAGDDLVGIDLDDVMSDGHFTNQLAEASVRSMDSYTEISPSGRGVKTWIRSTVQPERCTGTVDYAGESFDYETYHRGRWFAVTGHALPYGNGAVQARTEKYSRMLTMGAKAKVNPIRTSNPAVPVVPATGTVADEESMIRAALRHLDVDNEPNWFRSLCCLKSWGATVGDDTARELCMEWSKGSSKWDQDEFDLRWDRVEPDGGLTIGTIFCEAADDGYEYGDAVGRDGNEFHVEILEPWQADMEWWLAGVDGDPDFALKPTVELHGVGGWSQVTAVDAAGQLGAACSGCGEVFGRNGTVVYVRHGTTVPVESHDLAVVAARHTHLVFRKMSKGKDGPKVTFVPTNATSAQCNDILAAREFIDRLPPLNLISKCPVLVDDGKGGLRAVKGYDRESGVFALGGDAADVPLEDAKRLILEILSDFNFATPGDKSRAIAAMITPALVMGGLLPGRAPIDLGEADDSQAGKGYRQKLVTAVYNDAASVVAQRKGGSGSTEESYCAALIGGACFVALDNVRGKLDSPLIESSLTEPYCDARMPYGRPMQVDMRRVCVSMTSNSAELTRDLANRCSPVRIKKRPEGYVFKTYPEGDALAHVSANQGLYLGAVFAVIRAWAAAGRPMDVDAGHDFKGWARTLGWIIKNVFAEAPLCEGVRETQARMSNPNRGWVREVAIMALRQGLQGQPLRAHQIVRLLEDCGADVPGVEPGSELSDDENFRRANQAVGKKFASAFGKDSDVLAIDDMIISRTREIDEGKTVSSYSFSTSDRGKKTVDVGSGGGSGGSGGFCENQASRDARAERRYNQFDHLPPDLTRLPPDPPPDDSPDKPQCSPDTPDDSDIFLHIREFGRTAPSMDTIDITPGKNGGCQADQAALEEANTPRAQTNPTVPLVSGIAPEDDFLGENWNPGDPVFPVGKPGVGRGSAADATVVTIPATTPDTAKPSAEWNFGGPDPDDPFAIEP